MRGKSFPPRFLPCLAALGEGADAEAEGVELDEAFGVFLVVDGVGFEGGVVFAVEADR